MLDAFEKAGILLPDQRLRKIALQALESRDRSLKLLDPDPEATLCLFTVQEIEVRWQRHLDAVAKETGASLQPASHMAHDRPQPTPARDDRRDAKDRPSHAAH